MRERQLVVLTGADRAGEAKALTEALRNAWACGSCPAFEVQLLEGAVPRAVTREACGLLLLPRGYACTSSTDPTIRCLDSAHEDGVPALVLGDLLTPMRPDLVKVLQVPAATAPPIVAAVLAGMIGRQAELEQLKGQLETTMRVVGGVHEEMEKIDEELQAAALVQREFLPVELPTSGSISVSALWRPTSYVSGDYYDVRSIDEDRIGVFIADAAGHGVPSALMTMVLARAFETAQSGRPLMPDEVLTQLNKEFCLRQGGTTRFATAAYAVVNSTDGTITYASAGHPPPLLLGKDELRALDNENGGGLLGVFPDETFESMTEQLGPGETLLMHSDGFEQAFPLPDAGPTELAMPSTAYLNVFKSLGELDDPQEMVVRLANAIDSRRGSLHPCDDLTLLCVHRARESSPLSLTG